MVSGCDRFLLGHRNGVKEGLHWGLSEAPAALMRALFVVVADPQIEIDLQLVDRMVQLFAERDPIKLVEQSFVEALTNTVGLRALGLGARVVDVLDRKIELIFVPLRIAAVLAAAVGQHAQQLDFMAVEERQHPVVEEIGRRDRRLTIVQLSEANLGVGVDKGLLIDASNPLHVADIEGVLGAANSRDVRFRTRHGPLSRSSPFRARRAGLR